MMEWLRRLAKPKQETVVNTLSAVVPMWAANRPKDQSYDIRQMVDDAYRQNALIHACIAEISNSVAEPELIARDVKTKEPLPDDHPLQKLLVRPHPEYSKFSLFEMSLIHLQCTGESFLHKGRNRFGEVIQLTPLRPDRVKPIPDSEGKVTSYEYRIESTQKSQIIPREDMIAIMLPDPINDFRGLSPLMAAVRFAQIDVEASLYLRDFFMNGAVPAGLMVLKTPVRREERMRIKDEWHDNFGRGTTGQDISNWHRLAVLNADDVDYKDIGVTPEKLKMDSIWGITETRICMAFQVPPIIVQAKIGLERLTYAQYETAYKTFWNDTLRPMYGRYDEQLTIQLASEFDPERGIEVGFDLSHIAILQEGEDTKTTRTVSLWTSGLITREEARERLGMEKLGGDDVIIVPEKVVPVEQAIAAMKMAEEKAQAEADAAAQAQRQFGQLPPGPNKPAFPPKPGQKALPPGAKASKTPKPGEEPEEKQSNIVPFRVAGSTALAPAPEEVQATPTDAVIDKHKPALKRGVVTAVHSIQRAVDMGSLASAIRRGDADAAEAAVPWDMWRDLYGKVLRGHLTAVAKVAADATYSEHDSEEAVAQAAEQRATAEVDRTFTEGQAALRSAIAAAIDSDMEPEVAARVVRGCVGLTKEQVRAVMARA